MTFAQRIVRTVGATGVALLLPLAGAGAPLAAAARPDAAPAYLRLAHLSPDTPQGDVYVDSLADPSRSFTVPAVTYGTVSDYRSLPADDYVVSMRVAGAPADAPPVISAAVTTRPGAAYTALGRGRAPDASMNILTDKLDMPPAGKASVRVINGAPSVPTADVGPVDGPAWAKDVRFGTETAYVECPLGSWDLQVTSAQGATRVPLTLKENSTYTVLLVDRGDGLEPKITRDSTGAGTVPAGGVETGLGGSSAPDPLPVRAATGSALIVAALLVAATVRRRPGVRADHVGRR